MKNYTQEGIVSPLTLRFQKKAFFLLYGSHAICFAYRASHLKGDPKLTDK